MGTLYNGIGLNTVEAIRAGPPLGNTIQLSGFALVNNADPAATDHLIYEKSAVTFYNYTTALVAKQPLKLPAGANISKVYVKNLSFSNPNNPYAPPNSTYATGPTGWSVLSANAAGTAGTQTYVSGITSTNPGAAPNTAQFNTGIAVAPAAPANQLVDSTSLFQNAVLRNVGGVVTLTGIGGALPAQTQIVVEVIFVITVQ